MSSLPKIKTQSEKNEGYSERGFRIKIKGRKHQGQIRKNSQSTLSRKKCNASENVKPQSTSKKEINKIQILNKEIAKKSILMKETIKKEQPKRDEQKKIHKTNFTPTDSSKKKDFQYEGRGSTSQTLPVRAEIQVCLDNYKRYSISRRGQGEGVRGSAHSSEQGKKIIFNRYSGQNIQVKSLRLYSRLTRIAKIEYIIYSNRDPQNPTQIMFKV